jgi:hypothetical protein
VFSIPIYIFNLKAKKLVMSDLGISEKINSNQTNAIWRRGRRMIILAAFYSQWRPKPQKEE